MVSVERWRLVTAASDAADQGRRLARGYHHASGELSSRFSLAVCSLDAGIPDDGTGSCIAIGRRMAGEPGKVVSSSWFSCAVHHHVVRRMDSAPGLGCARYVCTSYHQVYDQLSGSLGPANTTNTTSTTRTTRTTSTISVSDARTLRSHTVVMVQCRSNTILAQRTPTDIHPCLK